MTRHQNPDFDVTHPGFVASPVWTEPKLTHGLVHDQRQWLPSVASFLDQKRGDLRGGQVSTNSISTVYDH